MIISDNRVNKLEKLFNKYNINELILGYGNNKVMYIPPELVIEEYELYQNSKILGQKGTYITILSTINDNWKTDYYHNWLTLRNFYRYLTLITGLTNQEYYDLLQYHNNNESDRPKCICGKECKFVKLKFGYGYINTCGNPSCIGETRAITNELYYGARNGLCGTPEVRELAMATDRLNNNGVLSFNTLASINKSLETRTKRYGSPDGIINNPLIQSKSKLGWYQSTHDIDSECYLYITKAIHNGIKVYKYGISEYVPSRIIRSLHDKNDNNYEDTHIILSGSSKDIPIVEYLLKINYYNGLEVFDFNGIELHKFFTNLRLLLKSNFSKQLDDKSIRSYLQALKDDQLVNNITSTTIEKL